MIVGVAMAVINILMDYVFDVPLRVRLIVIFTVAWVVEYIAAASLIGLQSVPIILRP